MTVRRPLPSAVPGLALPALGVPAALAVTALAALLLAGCGLFSRPEIEYYSLDPEAPPAPAGPLRPGAAPAAAGAVPLGLAAVELPPGLDRQEIVVRQDDGRLEVRGTELWAAPLGTMVLHTLGFALADRLPEGMVVLPGQTRPAGGVRTLDVVFEDLAAGPERVVVLDAHWTLRGAVGSTGAAGAVGLAGRERIAEPVDSLGSADVAAGTSRALARLADRLAAAAGAPPAPPESLVPEPLEEEPLELQPPGP